jgi:uncharacterized protein YbjT (DUF2867 family)
MLRENSRIAIIGGTGKAGRRVVEAALARGLEVRALSRRLPGSGDPKPGHDAVAGDARDPAALDALLEGCACVIVALASRQGEEPGFEAASRALVAAMKAKSIRRLVILVGLGIYVPGDRKGVGARARSAFMRLAFPKAMEDKQRGVEAIMASGLDWTIVRAPRIEEGLPLGSVAIDLRSPPRGFVRSADLAVFLLDAALGGSYSRTAPFVAGRRRLTAQA